ncbi:MAG: NERD domain-containing protein [Gammaproteobacteria bacterium]|nr:NERD domain-containing protein [Gammaproteobacteria bacterium]
MKTIIGWFGEKLTTFGMWVTLNSEVYQRFHNVIIPASNGTTQIDHLLVSPYGIFIVETKNIKGWIFGSAEQAKWTQSLYGKKYSFQNPVRQTYRQMKVLSDYIGIDESKIKTVVFFVGDCKFKTDMPSNVIRSGLGSYIKNFSNIVLSNSEIAQIIQKLNRHVSESTLRTRDHVRSLKQRHNSTTVCPKCGSSLVVRAAKQGANAGNKFLGCESYPKCRFTKNL